MALTYGFYNSINGDRVYDALQFGSIFDGVIKDGVFATYLKSFIVKASPTNSKEVIVQPGRAWFNHTWIYNDADLPIETLAPGVILDRIDALVFDINGDTSARENSIIWVSGAEVANNPQKPTMINTTTHHQYPLCYIYRKAGVYDVVQDNIENAIGTSACPFVTGLLETINVDQLLLQFEAQFRTFMTNNTSEFNTWFDGIKGILDEETAGHLQNEIAELQDEFTANNKRIYLDYKNGKYGYNTSASRGADTFHPFKEPNVGTYTFPAGIGATVDLGEDNTIRYANANNVYNTGYGNGVNDADNRANPSSFNYQSGVSAADNRANPSSVNYQSGYSQGVTNADNRANPSSVNYQTGYSAGWGNCSATKISSFTVHLHSSWGGLSADDNFTFNISYGPDGRVSGVTGGGTQYNDGHTDVYFVSAG